MPTTRSQELYNRAVSLLPCGVNSPVRAFLSVGAKPFYVDHAKGPYLFDVDGNRYIDFVSSWGAIILGHADDGLTAEIQAAVADGTSYGACHPYEPALAAMIAEAFPSIEMVRLTSSGTEAAMSAIRLARGAASKSGVIKFRGCYHGHVDSLLVKAGSGLATYGTPDSGGVPSDLAKHTFVAEFNHIDSVNRIVKDEADVACLIMEPVMGNMGVILPDKRFLEDVRDICSRRGIILIFDEVITGFRIAYGGAQEMYGVKADLTCLGKIVGGGFPIGAFGGRRDLMERLAPQGDVYQAGTLSGNPVAVRAGLYTLTRLKEEMPYEGLRVALARVATEAARIASDAGVPYAVNGLTSMFTGFFNGRDVVDYETASASDSRLYAAFFRAMLDEGVFFAPSQYEAAFLTMAHTGGVLEEVLDIYRRVFKKIKSV
jgi:glutamate-1-semialdehyde 2,1-aminomutase